MIDGIATDRTSEEALAGRFRALSEEKRLRILGLLRSGELCVCDLQDRVGASQSLLSFHLKILRDAGLVSGRRVGRWVYYSVDRGALDELAGFLETLEGSRSTASAPAPGASATVGGCC